MKPARTASRVRLFAYRAQLFRKHSIARSVASELASWEGSIVDTIQRFAAIPLDRSRVVEIGHGQRPLRLIWISALSAEAHGIDIETALLKFDLARIAQIAHREGMGRAFKTAVRSAVFDSKVYKEFEHAYCARFGAQPRPPNLHRGDAADLAFWREMGPVNLVYSEDVFEHIERDKIVAICELIRGSLARGGLFLPNVNVFTSVTGAHVPEWFRESVHDGRPKSTPPWGHLRRDDIHPDTFLNGLRLSDYRQIFSRYFTIEDEIEVYPGLGDQLLTPSIERELHQYSRDELLANNRRFILRV